MASSAKDSDVGCLRYVERSFDEIDYDDGHPWVGLAEMTLMLKSSDSREYPNQGVTVDKVFGGKYRSNRTLVVRIPDEQYQVLSEQERAGFESMQQNPARGALVSLEDALCYKPSTQAQKAGKKKSSIRQLLIIRVGHWEERMRSVPMPLIIFTSSGGNDLLEYPPPGWPIDGDTRNDWVGENYSGVYVILVSTLREFDGQPGYYLVIKFGMCKTNQLRTRAKQSCRDMKQRGGSEPRVLFVLRLDRDKAYPGEQELKRRMQTYDLNYARPDEHDSQKLELLKVAPKQTLLVRDQLQQVGWMDEYRRREIDHEEEEEKQEQVEVGVEDRAVGGAADDDTTATVEGFIASYDWHRGPTPFYDELFAKFNCPQLRQACERFGVRPNTYDNCIRVLWQNNSPRKRDAHPSEPPSATRRFSGLRLYLRTCATGQSLLQGQLQRPNIQPAASVGCGERQARETAKAYECYLESACVNGGQASGVQDSFQ